MSFGGGCMSMFLKALSGAAEYLKKAYRWLFEKTRNKVDPEESFVFEIRDKTERDK